MAGCNSCRRIYWLNNHIAIKWMTSAADIKLELFTLKFFKVFHRLGFIAKINQKWNSFCWKWTKQTKFDKYPHLRVRSCCFFRRFVRPAPRIELSRCRNFSPRGARSLRETRATGDSVRGGVSVCTYVTYVRGRWTQKNGAFRGNGERSLHRAGRRGPGPAVLGGGSPGAGRRVHKSSR